MNEIQRLRELLGLQRDRESFAELDQRVSATESRTADVAEVLPAAMDKALAEGNLADSLSRPVEQSIHVSIARDPQSFADILFPIMGPAIRKSIAEAMKSLVEGLNQTMQQSPLSPNWWKWRIESARTGLSFREVVLRHTLAYRISQAFLIQRDSGLLMAHASDLEEGGLDEDAVSAMLSAIQDFIRDSVGDADAGLSSAELGQHTVWTLPGPEGQLAAVIDGHPPLSLRNMLREKLEQMHGLHHSWMESYDGSAETPSDLQQLVDECLVQEQKQEPTPQQDQNEAANNRKKRGLLWALGLLLLGLLVWWAWSMFRDWQEGKVLAELKQRFEVAPGLVMIETDRGGDAIVVRGLGDPVADPVESLLQDLPLRREVRFEMNPYQSLDNEIMRRRLEAIIRPPDGVSIEVTDSAIRLNGEASAQWIGQARAFASAQSGGTRVELDGLRESAASQLARLSAELAPAAGAKLELVDGAVMVSGNASLAWVEQARERAARMITIPFDISALQLDEQRQLAQLKQRLEQRRFLFSGGTRIEPASRPELALAAAEIKQSVSLATNLDQPITVVLRGYTDSTGGVDINQQLRRNRATAIADALIALGVESDSLRAQAGTGGAATDQSDPQWRRVDIEVQLLEGGG